MIAGGSLEKFPVCSVAAVHLRSLSAWSSRIFARAKADSVLPAYSTECCIQSVALRLSSAGTGGVAGAADAAAVPGSVAPAAGVSAFSAQAASKRTVKATALRREKLATTELLCCTLG